MGAAPRCGLAGRPPAMKKADPLGAPFYAALSSLFARHGPICPTASRAAEFLGTIGGFWRAGQWGSSAPQPSQGGGLALFGALRASLLACYRRSPAHRTASCAASRSAPPRSKIAPARQPAAPPVFFCRKSIIFSRSAAQLEGRPPGFLAS